MASDHRKRVLYMYRDASWQLFSQLLRCTSQSSNSGGNESRKNASIYNLPSKDVNIACCLVASRNNNCMIIAFMIISDDVFLCICSNHVRCPVLLFSSLGWATGLEAFRSSRDILQEPHCSQLVAPTGTNSRWIHQTSLMSQDTMSHWRVLLIFLVLPLDSLDSDLFRQHHAVMQCMKIVLVHNSHSSACVLHLAIWSICSVLEVFIKHSSQSRRDSMTELFGEGTNFSTREIFASTFQARTR